MRPRSSSSPSVGSYVTDRVFRARLGAGIPRSRERQLVDPVSLRPRRLGSQQPVLSRKSDIGKSKSAIKWTSNESAEIVGHIAVVGHERDQVDKFARRPVIAEK